MPLARISSKILFFAHIPKTGGTSIETYMAGKGALALHCKKRGMWAKTTPQHMHADVFNKFIPESFVDFSFTVMRDPGDRFVSEYLHRKVMTGSSVAFVPWAKRVLAERKLKPALFDNHLRSQVNFLRAGMKVFLFESEFELVYDWIDTVTETPPLAHDVWKRKAKEEKPKLDEEIANLLAQSYRRDYALLRVLGSETGQTLTKEHLAAIGI